MRHSDIKTTQNYYINIEIDKMRVGMNSKMFATNLPPFQAGTAGISGQTKRENQKPQKINAD